MELSGARPSPPHRGLQVLEDDRAVVVEHVGDAAGAEPGPARCSPQQCQQERPERGPGGPLEGIQAQSLRRRRPSCSTAGNVLPPPPPPPPIPIHTHLYKGISKLV